MQARQTQARRVDPTSASCYFSVMTAPREILNAAAIEAMPGVSKVHDLNPNAVRVAKALGAAAGLTNLGISLMTVLPGKEASEYHRHLFEEECYYLLEGRGEVTIDEVTSPVGPGDFLGFRADGAAHTLKNCGDEPLVFLLIRQNLVQDVCDYPRRNKRLYMNGAEEAFVNLADVIKLKTS